MALPFLMLAVLFRGIENFKMFDLVVQLTGGGPGLDHRADLDQPQARGLREVAHGLCLGLRGDPVRDRVRPRLDLREGAEPGEGAMSAHSDHRAVAAAEVARRHPRRRSTRSSPSCRCSGSSPPASSRPSDAIAYPPKVALRALARGLRQPLHHAHPHARRTTLEALGPPQTWYDAHRARSTTW